MPTMPSHSRNYSRRSTMATVHSLNRDAFKRSWLRSLRNSVPGAGGLILLSLCVLACALPLPSLGQSQAGGHAPESSGSISGTVFDQSGAISVGAQVKLTREDQSPTREVLSGNNGQFSFANVAPGPCQLTVTSEGFTSQVSNGTLRPGDLSSFHQSCWRLPPSLRK